MASRTGNLNQDKKRSKVDAKTKSRTSTYASAKKQDPKLDSYIKTRNSAKKGSSEYNAAQNLINKAYNKTGPRKDTTPKGKATAMAKKKVVTKVSAKTPAPKPTLKTSTARPAPKPVAAVKRGRKTVAQGADREDVRADRKAARMEKRSKRQKSKVVTPKKRVGVMGNRAKATLNKKLKCLS